MDPFSYICVLTSIVAGLAVTRLVSGFGQLLQTRARTPPYWVHALWMVNVLLTMIITWWIRCLLSYLQPRNARKQSAAIDVALARGQHGPEPAPAIKFCHETACTRFALE